MLLEMNGICKDYIQGRMPVRVLSDISLQVEEGDYLAIMGPSGSGKTTLMNLIGCLDVPTGGSYLLNGEDIGSMKSDKLARVRNEVIGFVFQSFYLLPKLSALDNVALPLLYAGVSKRERRARARAALQKMGLGDRERSRPNQLSGGQCQRVAIARAIVTNPKLLLADEPTGALDSASGGQIMDIFDELNASGVTIIMITHEQEVAYRAKRICHIRDGMISGGMPSYASYGTPRKASYEENSFASGMGGDSFASGMVGDSFASGMGGNSFASGIGGDSFASGMGGDSFASGMGGNSFASGMGGDSFASGMGGDSFASGMGGDSFAPSAGADSLTEPKDNSFVEEGNPQPAPFASLPEDYFDMFDRVDPPVAEKPAYDMAVFAASEGIKETVDDLFGESKELTGHETDLAESASDIFASPETEDVFAPSEMGDVFAPSGEGDIFGLSDSDDLFAEPKKEIAFAEPALGDVFSAGDGEEFGDYV